jgi:hypothetical protein
MKSKFLKIAGVKSDKAFYKKYPTEAAFFKAHPEAKKTIKKAQGGIGSAIGAFAQNMQNIPNMQNMIQGQMQSPGVNANMFQSGNQQSVGGPINSPGNYNSWDIDNNGVNDIMQGPQNNPLNSQPIDYNQMYMNMSTEDEQLKGGEEKKGKGPSVGGIMNVLNGASEGWEALQAEKKLTDTLQTWAGVSGVVKDAAISNAFLPQQPREYYRPDDKRFTRNANELYMPKGRGSDSITQNGGNFIGGNRTEIQNTYVDDDTIYTDLEDPDNVKAYKGGGGFGSWLGQANSSLSGGGDTSFGGNIGSGSPFDGMIGGVFGNNAGSKFGGSLGSIFGPVGSLVGTAVGGYLDKEPGKQMAAQTNINSNQSFINRINMGADARRPFTANTQNGGDLVAYEDGGYMNPEYNPQVITMFGDHNADDFADYANKFRAGGHLKEYTPPSERAMQTYENGGEINSYALGGKLQSHWGGEVEDVSYNPYLPGSGKTAMIKGASHSKGGVGISFGGAQNGASTNSADIEAEFNEPVMEMEEGGSIDSNTGQPSTSAVVFGNIPFTKKVVAATEDADLMRLADEYDGMTIKKMIDKLNKKEIVATKKQAKGLTLMDDVDANNKWGKLDAQTAQTIVDATDLTLQQIATEKMKTADFQNTLHDLKEKISSVRGKNISAEDLGRGKIKDDIDPITKDAPLSKGKSGINIKKAQNSETIPATGTDITEEQYNDFVKKYESSKGTKGKANKDTLEFQRAYHKAFPQEALAAIQKTTKANGLSNKAKQMGLTVEDILEGKNIEKILQSNEDEYHGPRTDQYMASVKSKFNKAPELKLNDLQIRPQGSADKNDKKQFSVTAPKNNYVGAAANMLTRLLQKDNIPPIDPRQFAGEYVAAAQNTPEAVPMQRMQSQLAPIYRITNQKARNDSTASFRDALRMNQFNPEAASIIFGRKAMADQTSYDDEFKTNQAIEQQIFGGNRALINQDMATNLGFDRNQANLKSIANSKTKEINQNIASSFADKNMKYDADVMKYKVQRNLFPNFGYDQSGRIGTRGAWYNPVIPQIYGNESTIAEIPVYGPDGKIQYYKMGEEEKDTTKRPSTATEPFVPGQGYAKNGKSIVKNAKNSSVVKAYKNL